MISEEQTSWVTGLSRLRVLASLFFLVSFCILVSSAYGVEGAEALARINRADSAVVSAYRAVLEAEEAGANVSSLLRELNSGAEALARANMLYRVEDFDGAAYFADLCYDSVVDVAAEADGLRDVAASEGRTRVYLTSVASTFGVFCVVFGGFFGWRLFRKRYFRRVSKMKPDVVKEWV